MNMQFSEVTLKKIILYNAAQSSLSIEDVWSIQPGQSCTIYTLIQGFVCSMEINYNLEMFIISSVISNLYNHFITVIPFSGSHIPTLSSCWKHLKINTKST